MIKVKEFDISHKNSFDVLEDIKELIVDKVEKSWADICK